MAVITDRHARFASPRAVSVNAFADFDAFFAISIDLPIDVDLVWVRLTRDVGVSAHEGRKLPECIGFMSLRRVGTIAPGLSRYAVDALRPADAPPPEQSVCRRLSELIEPEGYELLQRQQTVVPASHRGVFRPWPVEGRGETPHEY